MIDFFTNIVVFDCGREYMIVDTDRTKYFRHTNFKYNYLSLLLAFLGPNLIKCFQRLATFVTKKVNDCDVNAQCCESGRRKLVTHLIYRLCISNDFSI